jgi:hypothetical protein
MRARARARGCACVHMNARAYYSTQRKRVLSAIRAPTAAEPPSGCASDRRVNGARWTTSPEPSHTVKCAELSSYQTCADCDCAQRNMLRRCAPEYLAAQSIHRLVLRSHEPATSARESLRVLMWHPSLGAISPALRQAASSGACLGARVLEAFDDRREVLRRQVHYGIA